MEDIYRRIFTTGSRSEAELLSQIAFAKDCDTVKYEYSLMRKEQILMSNDFMLRSFTHNFIPPIDSYDSAHYVLFTGNLKYLDNIEDYKYIESFQFDDMQVVQPYSNLCTYVYKIPDPYQITVHFRMLSTEISDKIKNRINSIMNCKLEM